MSLGGILYRPDITSGTRPALIVLHGWQTPGTDRAAVVEGRARLQPGRLMAAALDASGRQGSLLLVPGAAHGFTADQEALARPVVDRFLANRLQ